jgi:hypothetical protein
MTELFWLKKKREKYENTYDFWSRVIDSAAKCDNLLWKETKHLVEDTLKNNLFEVQNVTTPFTACQVFLIRACPSLFFSATTILR